MGRYADFLNRCKGLKDGTYKFNNLPVGGINLS